MNNKLTRWGKELETGEQKSELRVTPNLSTSKRGSDSQRRKVGWESQRRRVGGALKARDAATSEVQEDRLPGQGRPGR